MIPGAFPIIAGAPPFKANAVNYNGSSYLTMVSALIGAVGGTQGTASVWLKNSGISGPILIIGSVPSIDFDLNGSPLYGRFVVRTAAGAAVGQVNSNAGSFTPNIWNSLICSWDSSVPTAKFIINGVDSTNFGYGAGAIGWNAAQVGVGVYPAATQTRYTGDMAELFVDQRYIDLSIASNVARFRDPSTGKPVFLGLNGELVFGTAPLVYLSNPAATINTNQGSGGNFTITGSITAASSSPSD